MIRCIMIFLSVLLFINGANGQILGPELKTGNFELGYIGIWNHRNLDKESPCENRWGSRAIFARYGISRYFTLSFEAMIANYNGKNFPERDYREYVVGGGMVSRFMEIRSNQISLSFHYKEWFGFDRSRWRYHKNHRGIIISVQMERKLALYNQQIIFWGGPAYVLDEIKQYPGFPYVPYTDESYNNLGFTAGFNFIIKKHFDPFMHIVYADYFQPRIGLGYQF